MFILYCCELYLGQRPTKVILLNGVEIEVRMNLYELLQQLLRDQKGQGTKYVCSYEPPARARNYEERQKIRQSMQYPSRWEYFWIDALCINQASIEEKNHQVAMMRKIYSSASFVLVWLGPEADDSAIAMRVLDDMQIQGYTLLTLREERQRSQLNAMKKLFQRPY
jgi:Heterokaryon incompatibility protein (HET)